MASEMTLDETGPDFVLAELKQHLLKPNFSDLTIVCKNNAVIRAHRAVLAPVSKFFHSLISREAADDEGGSVTVIFPDFSKLVFQEFLSLVYKGEVAVDPAYKPQLTELIQLLDVTEDIMEKDEDEEDSMDTDEDNLDLLIPKTELRIPHSYAEVKQSSKVHVKIETANKSAAKQILSPDLIRKVIIDSSQTNLQPIDRRELDLKTREMLDQMEGDQSLGKKVDRCKCPRCQHCLISGERPYLHVCHYPDCQRSYKKTSHLRAHLRTHIGDQPFACTWENCGKKFTRSDELHRHYRIHTGEKNHKCPHCQKCFSRSDHLKKHVASHLKQQFSAISKRYST